MKFDNWDFIRKPADKIRVLLKFVKNNGYFIWQYLAEFFLEWEIKVVEKIKTHIWPSTSFLWKSCRLCENVEKCGGAREAADDYGAWALHAG
jgi:hypothetical protein